MNPLDTQVPDDKTPEQIIADFLVRYSTPEGIALLTSIVEQIKGSAQETISDASPRYPSVDTSVTTTPSPHALITHEELRNMHPNIFIHRDTISELHPHLREIYLFLDWDLERDQDTGIIYFAPFFPHLLIARSRLSSLTGSCVDRGLLLPSEITTTNDMIIASNWLFDWNPNHNDYQIWRILGRYFFMIYLYSHQVNDTLLYHIFGSDAQSLPISFDDLDEASQDRFYHGLFDFNRHDTEAIRICDDYLDQVYRSLHATLQVQRKQLDAILSWLSSCDRARLDTYVQEIDQLVSQLRYNKGTEPMRDLYSIDGYIALLRYADSMRYILASISDICEQSHMFVGARPTSPVWKTQQYLGRVAARLTTIEQKSHQMAMGEALIDSATKKSIRALIVELQSIQEWITNLDHIDQSNASSIHSKADTLMGMLTTLLDSTPPIISTLSRPSELTHEEWVDLSYTKKKHSLSAEQLSEYRDILSQIADLSMSSTQRNSASTKASKADGHTSNAVKNIMEYISVHLDELLDKNGYLSWQIVHDAYASTHAVTSWRRSKIIHEILKWSSSIDTSLRSFDDMIMLLPALVRQYAGQVQKHSKDPSSAPCSAYLSYLDNFLKNLTKAQ